MAEVQKETPKRGFLSRLFRLVFKLVLLCAVTASVGLTLGFRFQKEVLYKVEQADPATGDRCLVDRRIDCGKWPWQDASSFKSYALYWANRTEATGKDIKQEAVEKGKALTAKVQELDREYGVSEKAKAVVSTGAKKVSAGAKAVRNRLQEEFGESSGSKAVTQEVPEDLDAQRERNFGYTDAEREKLPEGFIDSVRAGEDSYRAARKAYERSQKGMQGWEGNLRESQGLFEEAFGHYERALKLNPLDERIKTDLIHIQEYMQACGRALPATSTY
ncbi:hypothetical protein ACFL59_00125 [Planctomycetota bacterium]